MCVNQTRQSRHILKKKLNTSSSHGERQLVKQFVFYLVTSLFRPCKLKSADALLNSAGLRVWLVQLEIEL